MRASRLRDGQTGASGTRADLGGRLLRGSVQAGVPVAAVFVLALRPDLVRLGRVALVGVDEVDAAARVPVIRDVHGARLAEVERGGEVQSLLRNAGFASVTTRDDLAGLPRVTGGRFNAG